MSVIRLPVLGPRSRPAGSLPWKSLVGLGLVGLLLLAQIHFGVAVLGNIWWAFPSWDNPATHGFEDLASVVPSYADPVREARDRVVSGGVVRLGSHGFVDPAFSAGNPALSSRITRSPPTA